MKHKTKKIIISAVVLFSIFYFLFSTPALAQIELETALPKIPGIPAPSGGLPEYINYLFVFGLGIIGVIALAVMMFGGIQYILAAGNVGKTTEAKEWIYAALTGLGLLLVSYLLLNTINPDLVKLKNPSFVPVGLQGQGLGAPEFKIKPGEFKLGGNCKTGDFVPNLGRSCVNGKWVDIPRPPSPA